jgi:hypothetical protein
MPTSRLIMTAAVVVLLVTVRALGQLSTNLLDDFDRSDNSTVGSTPTSPASLIWNEIETVAGAGAQIISSRLQLGSTTAGRDFAYVDVSSLSGYPVQLSLASDVVTWAFNMRQTRTDPSGFDASSYGIGFILGKTSDDVTTGEGYAVILGQSGSSDPIRLARFTAGPDLNSNFTDIISGNDYGNEFLSVKVAYTPSGDMWSLYVESGTSSFPRSDPRNTSTQVGSATMDNTFTLSLLKYMGCFWNHATIASDNAIFDDLYISDANQALPIQLASCTASVLRGNDVEVQWKTVSETNNFGFKIDRKRGESGPWTNIGFVEGHGTTLAPQSYSYLDHSVAFGKYQYRVRQIDLDRKYETFPEMEVNVGLEPGKSVLAQNYPNPFNPSTTIEFVVPQAGWVSLKVYNMLGQEITTLYDGNVEVGKVHTAEFCAGGLASGLYYYQLRGGGAVLTRRMMVLR